MNTWNSTGVSSIRNPSTPVRMYVMNTELISGKRVDISTEIPVGETKNTELSIRNTVNDLISPRIEDYPGT